MIITTRIKLKCCISNQTQTDLQTIFNTLDLLFVYEIK